jgi:predicted MFS family arabinose efflux permease
MLKLEENKGISRSLILMMAVLAGLSVANLYYNQPLLELIRRDLSVTEVQANLISVITQVGYATGLFLVIPMGDLYSRRKIILVCMLSAAVLSAIIGFAPYIVLVWVASYFLGVCSVIPQLFIPIAGQFSSPENKARNIGYVLSGLLTGILAARVISGYIGDWLGWRSMFFIASVIMVISCVISVRLMPDIQPNFRGNYLSLMHSILKIVRNHPRVRMNSIRAAFSFGSMLSIWSCLSFHLAQAPFYAGSEKVGMLGACGIGGAVAASGIGKYIPRYGIGHFSFVGAILQIVAWAIAFFFGDTYVGLIISIIMIDVGLQCLQLSNQSGCIQEIPEASNRVNTVFMTTYFIGGSLGTFLAGLGWKWAGWTGVCIAGTGMAVISLLISTAHHLLSHSTRR